VLLLPHTLPQRSARALDRTLPSATLSGHVTGRGLRVLVITAAALVAVLAGALAGRAVAGSVLPDLDELSMVADAVVPPDATDPRANDLSGAGPQNLNVFVTATPPTAGRSFQPAVPPEEAIEDIAAALRRNGWRDADAPSNLSRFERGWLTAQVSQTGPDRVSVSVSHRPRGLFYLPSLAAAVAGALVLAVLHRRFRRHPAPHLRPRET
jgi:hypothetical protein